MPGDVDPRMADLRKMPRVQLVDELARLRIQVGVLEAVRDAQAQEIQRLTEQLRAQRR